jgi:lon-related putative ATP-dependent protease
LDDLKGVLGQKRAVEAIDFGIKIQQDGYNLFAMGPTGTGKHTIIRQFLDARAISRDGVYDWCYVHNFDDPYKPLALRLPPGTARELEDTMENLVADLITSIPAAFESDEFQAQQNEIEAEFAEREQKPFEDLQVRARKREIALIRTPSGVAISPMKDGEVMPPEEFSKLAEETQADLTALMKEYHDEIEKLIHQSPKLRREMYRKIRNLNESLATQLVAELFADVLEAYSELPYVIAYLQAVQRDVVDSSDAFRPALQESGQAGLLLPGMASPEEQLRAIVDRYRVNRLIDHAKTKQSPVVYCDNPTFENLVGSIEHMAEMGNLVTNFTLIKPGALHEANGGYLIIDARELLGQPSAWVGLKRALRSNHIHTEPLGRYLSMVSTVSLEPQPIPLKVKVILVGERQLYYALRRYDPDFEELFKVVADFEESVPRNASISRKYARMIATVARREKLRHFDVAGVCRLIEYASRLAGDSRRLSVQMMHIADLAREADFHASEAGAKVIKAAHIDAALAAQEYRNGRFAERMRERVEDGTVMIDTEGERIGQINALSVYQVGGTAFGQPNRITSRVSAGSGRVIDIEREVHLGGKLHSKGVLILSSYLNAQFTPTKALSLSASIVFEQSYGGIDGDSASSTELYAILSAISELPIKQALAVTGSVNQFGEVQAIGGVNEKIEGFFATCKANGLQEDNGVLIPQANVSDLMLRSEVVEAVEAGKFHIYPVRSIEEGIRILTGVPAGRRLKSGKFAKGTVFALVEARLEEFAKKSDKDKKNGGADTGADDEGDSEGDSEGGRDEKGKDKKNRGGSR